MHPECPFVARVVDFAADELAPTQHREIEIHLRECAGCRGELASYRQLIDTLRAVPLPEPSGDLAQRVLAAVRAPHRAPSHWQTFGVWSAAAAAVALLCYLSFTPRAQSPATQAVVASEAKDPTTSLDRAINWLCINQEADGSWDAEKWGGNRNFKVALTALPAIAVIGKNPPTPERVAVAARAVEWLRAQQSDDGIIGPKNQGVPYNHSLSTLALLLHYRQNRDPGLKQSIRSAITAMVRAQSRDGGWGWKGASTSDSTITAWHIEALRLAHDVGVENSQAALTRGLAWVEALPGPDSVTDPAQITPGMILGQNGIPSGKGGLDLCQSYFLTIKFQREQDESSKRQLAEIRRGLLQDQVPEGDESGSWPPDDRWGRTGGRIYSTALASLSLEDE